MDTFDAILKSLPLTAFKYSTASSTFVDATGRGVTLSATPTTVAPITAGSKQSMHLVTPGVNFTTSVFVRGKERRAFSLEAVVQPTETVAGTISILSHTAVYDGLYLDAGYLRFAIEFNTLGTVTASYKIPEEFEKMVVIGTYQPGVMKLYVNGELVDQKEITDAQTKDGFKTRANNNLYLGPASNANKFVILDGVAVYARPLTDAEAYLHWNASNRVVESELATAFLRPLTFDGSGRDIYHIKEWNKINWSDALASGVTTVSDNLTPEIDYVTQLSKPGTWIGSYELAPATDLPKLYGAKIEWTGEGTALVETSVNGGSSWSPAVNEQMIVGTWDYTPTGAPILIRVTFTGGVSNDTTYISSIRVTGYVTPDLLGSTMNRKIVLSSGTVTSDVQSEPIERKRYSGIVSVVSSQTISADQDPDEPQTIAALEMWVKFDDATAGAYVFDNRPAGGTQYIWITGSPTKLLHPGGTMYVNGVLTATNVHTVLKGVWVHILYVFATPSPLSVLLAGFTATMKSYNLIKSYMTAPTATQAANIYNAYNGYPTSRLATDANPVTETSTAYKTAAFDWSVTSAG